MDFAEQEEGRFCGRLSLAQLPTERVRELARADGFHALDQFVRNANEQRFEPPANRVDRAARGQAVTDLQAVREQLLILGRPQPIEDRVERGVADGNERFKGRFREPRSVPVAQKGHEGRNGRLGSPGSQEIHRQHRLRGASFDDAEARGDPGVGRRLLAQPPQHVEGRKPVGRCDIAEEPAELLLRCLGERQPGLSHRLVHVLQGQEAQPDGVLPFAARPGEPLPTRAERPGERQGKPVMLTAGHALHQRVRQGDDGLDGAGPLAPATGAP